MACEEFEVLLNGYIDGELKDPDLKRFEEHLAGCPHCRKLVRDYRRLKEVTTEMRFKDPPQDIWNSYWQRVFHRITRGAGWGFFLVGVVAVAGFAIYEFATDPTVEALQKLIVFAIFVGLGLLLISVIWERVKASKTDKYKEIER